ncbi:MAG: aminomethyl-transferring glycine dehydrogenase subunit GcvPB, partial [Deltaproteobacteria bacterium]|nr:aminomethyl-transferring glycine dehydrogenase subunit GcvPB [Deltaproteobacteria bacterium]
MPGSATSGLSFQPPLIFEQGSPNRHGASLAPDDLPEVDAKSTFGDMARELPPLLPEVSEPDAVRHYVRLSQQNFAIDTG